MNRAARFFRNRLVTALLVNLLFLGAVLTVFYVQYETNDDQFMSIYLYGAANGETSPYIVYINIVLGWALKALADLFPGMPWHALMEYAVVFLAFTGISYRLLRRDRRTGLVLSVLILCSFGFDCYTQMQFTKVAGCAAAAGVLLLAGALRDRERRVPCALWGASLMVLGSAYRFRQFLLVSAAMAVYILFLFFRELRRREYRTLGRQIVWFAAVLALCGGLYLVNGAAYARNEGWDRYVRFNSYRVQLIDRSFPDYEENRELYGSLGLTEEDIELYKTWDFGDPELFTFDTVRTLAEARTDPEIDRAFLADFVETFSTGYFKYAWITAFLIAAALAVYGDRRNLLWLAAELVFVGAVSAALFYYERYLANRVDVGMFLALTVSLLGIYLDTAERPLFPEGRRAALAAALAVLVFLPNFAARIRTYYHRDEQTASHHELFDLASRDEEHVYLYSLRSGDALRDAYGMWEVKPAGSMKNMCPIGGCSAFTPVWDQVNASLGIDNPFSWCIDNDRAYLLDNRHIDAVVGYIRRHYSEDVYSVPVKRIDGNSFYQIVTLGRGPTAPVQEERSPDLTVGALSYALEGRKLSVSIEMYIDGVSSYMGEAWLELTGDDGRVYYQRMTQYETESGDPQAPPAADEHGKYGTFSTVRTLSGEGAWHAAILYSCGEECWRVEEFDP